VPAGPTSVDSAVASGGGRPVLEPDLMAAGSSRWPRFGAAALATHDGAASALTDPIDSRAEVHQATGMIMVQLAVSLAEALLRLWAHAYATGQTVAAVAADVVSRRMRFESGDAGDDA
jgi:hypothetical protein